MTKNHLDTALSNLHREAVAAGLIAEDEKIIHEKGSRVNGVSAELWLGRRGSRVHFVPRFTLRNTQREQVLMIEAATEALRAVRMAKLS